MKLLFSQKYTALLCFNYNLGQDKGVISNKDLLTVKELLYLTLRKAVLITKPKKFKHAL